MNYKVGTRGSKLALVQTNLVIDQLKKTFPEDNFEPVIIKTLGDKRLEAPIDQLGGRGVFVDEIEAALLEDRIQMAVHSMKDMPVELRQGLIMAEPPKREDPRDVLICREADSLTSLREGAIIATCSKRRAFQLRKLRPDLEFVDIRGNIDTRLRKLSEPMADGRYMDGIVLAAAGLHRLGRQDEITQYFTIEEMIPSPCQGILAVELRESDRGLYEKLSAVSDAATIKAAEAERSFLKSVGGSCHLPIGAYLDTDNNILHTLFGNEDGSLMDIKREKYE